MSCDSYLAAFGAKRTSASGCLTIAVYEYTHQVVLTKVVVFSTNDLVDDRLCVLIPMLCPTAVTNPEGDFGTTKASVHWRKLIPSLRPVTWPRLQKSQRCTSCVRPRTGSVPRVFCPMCELLHTASANQTCDSTILLWEQAPLALNAQRPPITGVPGAPAFGGIRPALSGSVVRRTASIQNNSGLLRKIQVCPKDLPTAR